MFDAIANLAVRRSWRVVVSALVFAAVAAVFGGGVAEVMSNDRADFDAPDSESVEARERLAEALGVKSIPSFELEESIDAGRGALKKRRFKPRVLLAEDNIVNQKVAMRVLEKSGYHVDVVADGTEAVKALESITYDLVLMDCQMPEMDGYEATRIIRSPESAVLNHDIPVIAVTAHAMRSDCERCFEAGMDDYIAKPIDPLKLMKVIEKWIDSLDELVDKPAG